MNFTPKTNDTEQNEVLIFTKHSTKRNFTIQK